MRVVKKALHFLSLQWVLSTIKKKQWHYFSTSLETFCLDGCKSVSKQYTSTKKQVLKSKHTPGWLLFTISAFLLPPKPQKPHGVIIRTIRRKGRRISPWQSTAAATGWSPCLPSSLQTSSVSAQKSTCSILHQVVEVFVFETTSCWTLNATCLKRHLLPGTAKHLSLETSIPWQAGISLWAPYLLTVSGITDNR